MDELWECRLGLVEYAAATALQERLRSARQAGALPDVLLLLEHPPVYTRGRRSDPAELPMSPEWYAQRGIAIADTNRGGKVTYHGPGQLVGYPIMRVRDVLAYVRTLERTMLAALEQEGIGASVRPGLTGVWVGERKIGSIGVHVARGVTTHGFAINVDNDLAPFDWIVPCGIGGVQMTSVALEAGHPPAMARFSERIAEGFAASFGRRRRALSAAQLERAIAPVPAASTVVAGRA